MMKTLSLTVIVLLLITACQPTVPAGAPTDIPFPTMTVGVDVSGVLSTPSARTGILPGQVSEESIVSANRVTPTPDSGRCPFPSDSAVLASFPDSRVGAINELLQFLNDGGSVQRLQDEILTTWDAFGESGYLETTDLTGEGTADIVLGYTAPGDVGTLLVFGCQAGRYVQLLEIVSDGIAPPILLALEDINNSSPAEIVFTRRICVDPEACEFQTQIMMWEFTVGRFVNLMTDTVITLDPPELRDIDNDLVNELVIDLDSNGTVATGPLRLGTNIYDWNGELYLLSIIQLEPPQYLIQVLQEGDRLFSLLRVAEAIDVYEAGLDNDDLRYWFNDGPVNTVSYGQYRLILAYSYLGDSAGVLNSLTAMNDSFPLEAEETFDDLPVYVQMANVFVESLTATGNLHESCIAVLDIIELREDEALGFINRYGSRSPTYTALDLCPY